MYLSKNQIKALEFALEALDYGLRCDIQQDESTFATDVISKMLYSARIRKNMKKLRSTIERAKQE